MDSQSTWRCPIISKIIHEHEEIGRPQCVIVMIGRGDTNFLPSALKMAENLGERLPWLMIGWKDDDKAISKILKAKRIQNLHYSFHGEQISAIPSSRLSSIWNCKRLLFLDFTAMIIQG
jgi:hypothetical protein